MKNSAYLEKKFDSDNYYLYFKKDYELAGYSHYHRWFELLYVIDGECDACINGNSYSVGKDDLVLVNTLDVHYYRKVSNEISCFVLVCDDSYLDGFYNFYGREKFQCVCKNHEINSRLRDILELWHKNGTNNKLENSGYVNLLVSVLAENYISYENKSDELDGKVILNYIQEHYTENLTAKQVAKKIGYSTAYFSCIFNKLAGENFRSYLNRLRYEKAQAILTDKNKTVEEAVTLVGFSSSAMYYRAKKRNKSNKKIE